jgi:hypothetical protein
LERCVGRVVVALFGKLDAINPAVAGAYSACPRHSAAAHTALAALARRRGLSPIGQVLSINDGGLQLDPAQWMTT